MKIRTLLVDDEPLGRDRIRTLLASEPDIEIIGEAEDGESALERITALTPDLVFLDIQMPGLDGFGVLRQLKGHMPLIVFVTAYDQHAIRAFEEHALDYLLKPARPARLKDAVQRARERFATQVPITLPPQLLELLNQRAAERPKVTRFPVRTNERTTFIKVTAVDWIEAAGNYVILHVGKETHILRDTLAALEGQLPTNFLRVSRSAVVNLDRVRELQSMAAGEHVVLLQDGRQIPMTRGIREVEERLRFS
jgi:two-component system, LytTR family, response regulator